VIEHHRARRLALQGLCCLDVRGRDALAETFEFIADGRENPQTQTEAGVMLRGAFAARAQADRLINRESHDWNVGRMALVDRNILRLGVWELLARQRSRKVVIDEAVRLAKEFSSAESGRFVNGVLDAVARGLRETKDDASEPHRDSEEPRQE
jgi:N utilization substance protein B